MREHLREFWWCWLLIAAALMLDYIPWIGAAQAQDSWQCYTTQSMQICSGYINGRYVTCTTTYVGSFANTTCS